MKKVIKIENGRLFFDEDITEIFEDNGFAVKSIKRDNESDDYYVEFYGDNPYGEDWFEALYFDGTLKDLVNNLNRVWENFDINEDVWFNSMNKTGVPTDELMKNAEFKDNALGELFNDFHDFAYKERVMSYSNFSTDNRKPKLTFWF